MFLVDASHIVDDDLVVDTRRDKSEWKSDDLVASHSSVFISVPLISENGNLISL